MFVAPVDADDGNMYAQLDVDSADSSRPPKKVQQAPQLLPLLKVRKQSSGKRVAGAGAAVTSTASGSGDSEDEESRQSRAKSDAQGSDCDSCTSSVDDDEQVEDDSEDD